VPGSCVGLRQDLVAGVGPARNVVGYSSKHRGFSVVMLFLSLEVSMKGMDIGT